MVKAFATVLVSIAVYVEMNIILTQNKFYNNLVSMCITVHVC